MSYGQAEYLQYVAHAMGSATHSLSLAFVVLWPPRI
jgi:hypothetical protein